MISVKHLSKKFGDVTVLKDINLDIKEKEVVVIIGPSGSGKSTILRCLNHLETPSGGEIVIDGIKLEEGANLNAIRREVGMVFQRFNLFPNMTVLQNIMLAPMQVRGKSKEEAKEKKKDKKQESNEQEKSNNEVKAEQQEETKTAQQAKLANTETESTTKKRKTRKKLVLAVLAIALLKEIGENYISMFWQNMKYRGIAAVVNFLAIFTLTYTTTTKVKRGLKVFFEDEKKEMPKLPQKSISFIFATLVTIGTTGMIVEKALPCFFNTQFVTTDPALGLDIGFFVFILPFLKFITIYALVAMIAAVVYATLYYLIVFNICFDGISRESVKKSGLLNNALGYLKVIIVLFAILMLIGTLDIGVQKFIVLNNDESENYSIFGAGITETTIGFWGYIALSVIMIVSAFKAIKEFQKGRTKKVIGSILVVPGYLFSLLLVMLGFNLIFVNSNELDKEKKYIENNINNTKIAYGINIDEVNVQDGGTITQNDITENIETIQNIPIANASTVLKDLEGSQKNKGYYNFRSTQIGLYNISGKEQLVYVTPREIASSKGTYNNKTYELTHGIGQIIVDANKTSEEGNIQYIQKEIDDNQRIYYGLETNSIVVTNTKNKEEYDYTDSEGEEHTYSYEGKSGIQVGFLDRLILAVRNKDFKLAFSTSVTNQSKILTNRNVIERAKTALPYLLYDENAYTVIKDNQIYWVIDAYTISDKYPYSSYTTIDGEKEKRDINYIRNSVKVIINAYNGEMKFYIVDKTDPIISAYKKIYPAMFEENDIPEEIQKQLKYPQLLYNVQAEMLRVYHNVKEDVLYRKSDIWSLATYGKSTSKTKTATLEPYYTMLKTPDGETRFGLVQMYTQKNKTNIISYVLGTCNGTSNELKIYKFSADSNILGANQLDNLIEQDETISAELNSLNVTGVKISKEMKIIPINNTLLYIETIYQTKTNEII